MARLPRAVDENMLFLCAELDGQLSSLLSYFEKPDSAVAQKVALRAGYTFNLHSRIYNASSRALTKNKANQSNRLLLQNMELIARNLDLISRLARRSLLYAEDVRRKDLLRAAAYAKITKYVRSAVNEIRPAIEDRDSKTAVKIGQVKGRLDDLYDKIFKTYTDDMRNSKHTKDLANSLLVANEIRRMGDALQSISEAILSVTIGQSVHFERYFTLKSILSDSGAFSKRTELATLAETRSGSTISGVRKKNSAADSIDAVFKDGELSKVREERAGVKSWHSIYPGLAPKILSYQKHGQSAALLIEHLPGHTFESLLLDESASGLKEAQKALEKTLRDIWRRTRTDEPAEMASMSQLSNRMKDVTRVHPEFQPADSKIGGLALPSFDDLVTRAGKRERALPAPFSVYIHGDFNLDNVIYDPAEKKIHFIDLHRSRYMDYVQDVSVFMVSTYRLQIQNAPIRRRITRVACDVHQMAAKFARAQKDKTFEYRLALGLARSFATSTRFVFDKAHASRMFLRARFLLEMALACPQGKEARLRVPVEELFSD
ncbi:phosphotransferase [Rhodobacteraceae bacterium NNCM2]|nr:phosphotransferase [Coraliihabitans acroporae]